jgi:hypothetical protein
MRCDGRIPISPLILVMKIPDVEDVSLLQP